MELQPPFRTQVHLRWADIDANFHVRHSVYYDLCAQQRTEALEELGITLDLMKEGHFGPVLFREECTFRRELKLHDTIMLEVRMRSLSKDHSRFSFEHVFLKEDGTWIDTQRRKLSAPPLLAEQAMDHVPRTADFAWI